MIRLFLTLTIFLPGFLFAQTDTTATVVIKDKTKYSKEFLSQLKSFPYSRHYQLVDSLLIIGQLDTAYFPTDLHLNKPKTLSGRSTDTVYKITVTRVNYTTILYSITIYKANKLLYSHKGYGDISASFFLGSESDEDEKTGISYGSTEYSNQTTNCILSIRIGKNDVGKLCAKLKKHCKDRAKDIQFDDSPTLYEK